MRRMALLLTSMVLALGLIFFGANIGSGSDDMRTAEAQTAPAKPNIVFILTDDMRKDDLRYMPKTRSLLGNKGMTFSNAFVSNALCCPSRATIMRGQYSHNNGVWTNETNGQVGGGWQAYQSRGHEQDNVATRLDAAGYRTGYFGKYLNGYGNTTYKPPGWDRWFANLDPTTYNYFNYDINDNGTKTHFGTTNSDYKTDVLSSKANAFISYGASQGTPFFAYVAPVAPHEPATPAPRDLHTYDGEKAARPPSFNEQDVSDKPSWIRQLPGLTTDQISTIDRTHENRAESLQAVDDLVEGVVNTLRNAGVMNNTYIFFTSDNGWHEGEHRIPKGKMRPYEEDIRMPLLVRGPDVGAGTTTDKLALNTDYLPTFTNIAGIEAPSYVDGRSLRPVLTGTVSTWRSAILLEGSQSNSPPYYGIRTVVGTSKRKYVEYSGGVKEMYYLGEDPYELTNNNPGAPPSDLVSRLQSLKTCSADTCRAAENGP